MGAARRGGFRGGRQQAAVTSALFNHLADGLNLVVGHLEDVVDAVQHHVDHLRVLDPQQVAEGVDDALGHHVGHLKCQGHLFVSLLNV